MNSVYQRAEHYLAKVDPASEGGRNDALNKLAYAILERFDLGESDFERLLGSWALRCTPPLPDVEVTKTLRSAWQGARRNGAVGAKALAIAPPDRNGGGHGHYHPPHPSPKPAATAPAPPVVSKHYDLTAAPANLPAAVPDGARLLLRSAFHAGEGVRIVNARLKEDDAGEEPDGAGPCLTREDWLKKLDNAKGNPNAIFSSSKKTGIYIGLNPMKVGGSKDSDVTSYRHALVEFDSGLTPQQQWHLYQSSRLPCAAIIYSGGKSVHAWVKIEAQSKQEYDERVKLLYDHFAAAGLHLDVANKNPGRLSRLPSCVRFSKRQELLALNTGVETWAEWHSSIIADSYGETWTVGDLLGYKVGTDDPNNVLGNRWLCRGGSCVLIAPSGVGKSSLSTQAAVFWALGRPFAGIDPHGPRRVVIIQAENDQGDTAEMVSGVYANIGFLSDDEDALIRKNLVFVREDSRVGLEFLTAAQRIVDRHRAEIVVVDPLLSFVGGDISRQDVCGQFFRTWLGPVARASGAVWFFVHHTGKPPTDSKARKHWKDSDFSYSGLGSSELTNWTRAAMVLEQAGHGAYRLRMTKRGKRAGATHPDGTPTTNIWLKQSETGIYWHQIDPPEQAPADDSKGGRPSTVEHVACTSFSGPFLAACLPEGESKTKLAERLEAWLAAHNEDVSSATCRRIITRMVENQKLRKTDRGLYVKGPNA